MKVVILCGGKGTRLWEETEYRPKPMVEIGGKPILWHIMKLYSHFGFKEFVLCLGCRGNVIREYFLNYAAMNNDCTIDLGSAAQIVHHNGHDESDWRVTLVETGLETPKGGRLLRARPYLAEDRFLLTYGDGVADLDIPATIEHHRRSRRMVTFTGVKPRSRFAVPELNHQGHVVSWQEKKLLDSYINGGFFVLSSGIFDYLRDDVELEEQPMERLAAEDQVTMYPHDGLWECMDTYRDYLHLNELWRKGNPFWAVWERGSQPRRTAAVAAGT